MKIRILGSSKNLEGQNLRSQGRDKLLRKFIEYGIYGLLIFSPLPAASVYEWSILVIQLTVLAMAAAYFLMREKPSINPNLSLSLKWPRYAFIGLFVFIGIQMIPLPNFLIKVISPNGYAFQESFSPHFPKIKFMSLSLVPAHTLREALEFLTYVLLGFLILRTVTHRHQIKRILFLLLGMGVFQAFYGLFELARSSPRILFYKKIYNLDSVTGTFVNRNHFSGYLEMIFPLAIGLIIARIDLFSTSGKRWLEKIIVFFGKGFSQNLLISLGVVIISLGIVFSNSRSGVFLFVFAFLLFLELSVLFFGRHRLKQVWVKNFLKITFLFITLFSLYIGIGATIGRFSLDNLLQEGRPLYWRNVTSVIRSFPLFGSGLGTFADAYAVYEEEGPENLLLLHAHNDYLEYLSELGLVGMGLLLGGVLFMAVNAFLVWKGRRNPEVKGLVLGGLVAIILMMIHSITDFNLHIPANMLLFTVVLSLTLVMAYYRKK